MKHHHKNQAHQTSTRSPMRCMHHSKFQKMTCLYI